MKNLWDSRILLPCAVAVFAMLWAVDGLVLAAEDYDQHVQSGRRSLQDGKFAEAAKAFEAAAQSVSDDHARVAEACFYRALVEHIQSSDKKLSAEAVAGFRRSALAYYGDALAMNPKLGAALNNSAKLLAEGKQYESADAAFRKAIALKDDRQLEYSRNYADLLAMRDSSLAAKWYQIVSDADPRDDLAFDRCLELLQRSDESDDAIMDLLWGQIRNCQYDRVRDEAIKLLKQTHFNGQPKVCNELLSVLTTSLAKQVIPSAVSNSASDESRSDHLRGSQGWLADRLEPLQEIDLIRPAIRDLQRVYLEPDRSDWWIKQERFDRFEDPKRGVWPKDAFVQLLISIGDYHRQRDRSELAESYYRSATEFGDDVDPDAFLRLFNSTFARHGKEDAERLLKQHEFSLFEGKGAAYRNSRVARIYSFHYALGNAYAQLKDYGSENDSHSAIFQLRRAISTADQFNRSRPSAGPLQRISVDPSLFELLSDCYRQVERPADAVAIRFSAAEEYLDKQDYSSCRRVLEVLGRESPNNAARLEDLKVKLEAAERKGAAVGTPGTQGPFTIGRAAGIPSDIESQTQKLLDFMSNRSGADDPARFELLPKNVGPEGSIDIRFDGKHGKATIETNDQKKYVVPFQRAGSSTPNSPSAGFRAVRP